MMHVRKLFLKLLLFVFLSDSVRGSILANILSGNYTDDTVNNVIPTLKAKNYYCRNDSLMFALELRKYTLWAVEMFDATTKFPTGFLEGSSYDFGNYDECIQLEVPNENFTGKYCMAKFKLLPPTIQNDSPSMDYLSNYTMWHKIIDYQQDPSKNPRNELRFAFCMPSSCRNTDLQETLSEVVHKFNEEVGFKVTVEVDEITCQVKGDFTLDTGDVIFLVVITIAVLNVVIGSIYDYVTQLNKSPQFQLTGKIHDTLVSFSFQRNVKKLSTVNKSDVDNLNCMAGMKVYSMFPIILVHRNMVDFGSAINNPKYVEAFYSKFHATLLLNAPILVDTFFTLSGFLASYLTLNYYFKAKKNYSVTKLYVHRYIRMTSTYWVIIAFYCTLFVKLGNGPLWRERVEIEQQKCRQVWWANLLFINNYYDTKHYCMFQSWYMACDMNAFIFVPILGLLLLKKPTVGVISVISLIVASTIAVFVTVYVYDEFPLLMVYMKLLLHPSEDSTFVRVYIPGHLRAGSYFVGVLTGYIKYRMNLKNSKVPSGWISFGWIVCVLVMFLSLHVGFVFYVTKIPAWFSAFYAAFYHIGWSIGIAWMLITISSGYGHLVNRILSWSPLVVLSRLSYTVYLCHGSIQMFTAGTIRHPVYTSTFNTIHSFAADVILAYMLAFVLTLVFESPIIGIEKILTKGQKRTPENNEKVIPATTELPTINK